MRSSVHAAARRLRLCGLPVRSPRCVPARAQPCPPPRAALCVARPSRAFTPRACRGLSVKASAASPEAVDAQWPQRTAHCGTLRDEHVGTRVTLCGWIDKQRNLGGLVFADVRDHTGLVQARLHLRVCCCSVSPLLTLMNLCNVTLHYMYDRWCPPSPAPHGLLWKESVPSTSFA